MIDDVRRNLLLRVHQRRKQRRYVGVAVGDVAIERMVHQDFGAQAIDAGSAGEGAEGMPQRVSGMRHLLTTVLLDLCHVPAVGRKHPDIAFLWIEGLPKLSDAPQTFDHWL